MTDRARIDTSALDGVRLSSDGSRLILLLRDTSGQKVSVSLPTNCLNTVLTAASRPVETGTVHSLDTWNMAQAENSQDLILTLCTPEGLTISYIIKRWQVQGMATVATYGATRGAAIRSIH
jgi:hypothetical protein